MKIAVWHNLPSGGGKRALYDHVRGLVERGHVVEAWCPDIADSTYLPLSDMIVEHRLPFPSVSTRGGPFGRLMEPYSDVVNKLAAMDTHCRACAQEIEHGGFDLLFANACQSFRVTSIARDVSLPKVLYLQEPYRDLYEALPVLPWAAMPPRQVRWGREEFRARVQDAARIQGLRIQVREERANAAAFDMILANSLYSRESILRAYGLDSKVCYLGVDTDKFRRREVAKANEVIGIGAFVREKNIEFVIEAVGAVPAPRPKLTWIGNVAWPPYLEDLKRFAEGHGVELDAKVRVTDDELLDALSRAFAFVYASRLEPFGLAPLEAGACGLPVIAIAEGGVRETIVDHVNGLVVEHDPGAMAAAIEQLRDDPVCARLLGERGERLVHDRWSLPSAIDRLEARLLEVLRRVQDPSLTVRS